MHRGPERRGWRGKSATRTIGQGSSSVDGKVNIAHAMVDRPDGRCAGQGEPHPWGTRTFGTPLSTLASNCRSFRNRIDAKLERQRPGMSCRNMVRRFESGRRVWHLSYQRVELLCARNGRNALSGEIYNRVRLRLEQREPGAARTDQRERRLRSPHPNRHFALCTRTVRLGRVEVLSALVSSTAIRV